MKVQAEPIGLRRGRVEGLTVEPSGEEFRAVARVLLAWAEVWGKRGERMERVHGGRRKGLTLH